MKKNLILLLTVICFFFEKNISAQGLIFNKDAFDKGTQMEMPRGPLPTRYSLKAYTSYSYMQTGATCVAQSFAFARTILAARQLRIRNRDTITQYLSFSPYFIY